MIDARPTTSVAARALAAQGYLRRSPFSQGGDGKHKEWLHFVIYTEGLELLVNFSLVDDCRPGATPGAEHARLVVLVRSANPRGTDTAPLGTHPEHTAREWDGAIERFEADDWSVRSGGLSMTFGQNHVELVEDRLFLHIALRDRPIALDLALRPETIAAPCHNIRFETDQRPINWMFCPRLAANGTASIGGVRHVIRDGLAYHDHNWGHFEWGRDFAWEWGFAFPDDRRVPWSVVYVRLTDRGRTRTYKQGLFLWRGERVMRAFRCPDLQVASAGALRTARPFKLPGIMNVLAPGSAVDVPAALECTADDTRDRVALTFRSHDVAQVCIPNDTDDTGITIINEVSGRVTLRGTVCGEDVALTGPAMFEFIRGA